MNFQTIVLIALLMLIPVSAVIISPIIDTDKSVNTHSINTIINDLIKPGMTNQQKLDALLSFHRRMMHHFRLEQGTEDNTSDFDIVKVYNVYGCSWCTQQAVIFRALLEPVFGYSNVRVPGSEGPLKTSGQLGGHSSFEVRFSSTDTWHWVDPIIGAYAYNKTNGAIASLTEIKSDHSILTDAVKDGRASDPFFQCTHGEKSTTNDISEAYAYYDYDTEFMNGFADRLTAPDVSWARQSAMFTMAKNLKKGESYTWLWDYLAIDNHNIQDMTFAHINGTLTRNWEWYPPRHLCGAKDSVDKKNWPYFKPYAKFINDRISYRYFANGIHRFEPDLKSRDAFDAITPVNASFYFNDFKFPEVRPTELNVIASVPYRMKIAYPLMDLKISGEYTRATTDDSIAIIVSQLFFNTKYGWSSSYRDTLSNEPESLLAVLPVSKHGTFSYSLRNFVDPLYRSMFQTYYGYKVRFVMNAKTRTENVGIHKFKAEAVFQHNMFALPQLEPGKNQMTIRSSNTDTSFRDNKLEFSVNWMDSGSVSSYKRRVPTSKDTFDIYVKQNDIPKMLSMTLSNRSDTAFDNIAAERDYSSAANQDTELSASPNPFNPAVSLHFTGIKTLSYITIHSADGRLIKMFSVLPGNSMIKWDAEGLSSGIYFATLKSGDNKKSIRLLLAR
ncbi:MAG: T9SS type A sorting domain-containing protein [Fibrobacteres bacterium]|nr:T9SS type A sorting domain-containing protein [Fibrobacterota bacterium]